MCGTHSIIPKKERERKKIFQKESQSAAPLVPSDLLMAHHDARNS